MAQDVEPLYPNKLREVREQEKLLTRAALSSLCAELADRSPAMYKRVSVTTIRYLEVGATRPQLSTARTLAAVLQTPHGELFPMGIDDPKRNPHGRTRIDPDRAKGGRPKKRPAD
jgi:hypothetical protein